MKTKSIMLILLGFGLVQSCDQMLSKVEVMTKEVVRHLSGDRSNGLHYQGVPGQATPKQNGRVEKRIDGFRPYAPNVKTRNGSLQQPTHLNQPKD